jgi:hypothetical protein
MMGEPARSQADRGMQVVLLECNLRHYVISQGNVNVVARDWPVALRPARSAYHRGNRIEFVWEGLDALTNVALARAPSGWRRVQDSAGFCAVEIP